ILYFFESRWLIVDESDRLFEVVEGQERCFRNQLASVYKACDGKFTRRAFFSATFSYEVEEWCKENLNNVAMVCIGERNSANANVTQELVFAGSEQGKLLAIRTLLQTQFDPPALIFVQSKERARELLSALSSITPPIPVALISSEKSQSERDNVIASFRSGRIWVLICTELMGRGLDLRNVNLVINFDLPTSIVSYIHRIGRTGRAGRRGRAITYFTESDTKYLRSIATVIHQAGFEVPEYTLSLKPLSRNEKKQLVRHAPKRKHIAFVKKKKLKAIQAEKGSKQSDEPAKKKAKVDKADEVSRNERTVTNGGNKRKSRAIVGDSKESPSSEKQRSSDEVSPKKIKKKSKLSKKKTL
ncbi:DEAD/DEAH box helicase domain-containing protein, partial [Trichostrongylus colubriformis]